MFANSVEARRFESYAKFDQPRLRMRHRPSQGQAADLASAELPLGTMLVLTPSACLFLATVEILIAGDNIVIL